MFHLFTNNSGPYIVQIESLFGHANSEYRNFMKACPTLLLASELRAAHVFNLNSLDARSACPSNKVVFGEPRSDEPYPGDRVVLLANFWHPNFGNSDETMVYSTCIYLYVLVLDSKELESGQGMLGVSGALNKLQYLRLSILIYHIRLFGCGGLYGFVMSTFLAGASFSRLYGSYPGQAALNFSS